MNGPFEQLHGYHIEDLEEGMAASISRTFTEQDVAAYAGLSTDDNPLHMDEEFAALTRTGGRVIHGMITASLISAIIGTRLPGPGCLWMAQDMRFLKPVRIGEHVHAMAQVSGIRRERQHVLLETVCRVGDSVVVDGHATVWVPARPPGA